MTGICRACGQQIIIQDEWLIEPGNGAKEVDDIATEKCNCIEGHSLRKEMWATDAIKKMFPEKEYDSVRDTLIMSLPAVIDEGIEQISMNLANGIKVRMKMNTKGKIRIDRTKTKNEAAEV